MLILAVNSMSLCSYYFELKIPHNICDPQEFYWHLTILTSQNERLEIPRFDICTPKT